VCNHEFEAIVILSQSTMGEPDRCPQCANKLIEKMISAPAQIRTDGRRGLRTVPDPKPPLQGLKEKGPREGCEGGYEDLEEWTKPVRKKGKDGNFYWEDKKKHYFDAGKT
jgi:hypothetical protein